MNAPKAAASLEPITTLVWLLKSFSDPLVILLDIRVRFNKSALFKPLTSAPDERFLYETNTWDSIIGDAWITPLELATWLTTFL